MDIFDKCRGEGGYLGMFRVKSDRYYTRPILNPYPGPEMEFQGKKVIIWSINNYLGLARNEELHKVSIEAIKEYGASAPMGSRMLTGNTTKHEALERKLAEYEKKE